MSEQLPGEFAPALDSVLFFVGLFLVLALAVFLIWWLRVIKK